MVSKEYITAISEFNIIEDCDLIGFSWTDYFITRKKKVFKLVMANLFQSILKNQWFIILGKMTSKNGGEGAPISPVYHKFLIENYKLELPSCILNIGVFQT